MLDPGFPPRQSLGWRLHLPLSGRKGFMNRRVTRAVLFAAGSLLTVLAAESRAASGWSLEGCWSPYPNCVGAKDVYVDSSGNHWECGVCGTTRNPSPST